MHNSLTSERSVAVDIKLTWAVSLFFNNKRKSGNGINFKLSLSHDDINNLAYDIVYPFHSCLQVLPGGSAVLLIAHLWLSRAGI